MIMPISVTYISWLRNRNNFFSGVLSTEYVLNVSLLLCYSAKPQIVSDVTRHLPL